MLGNNKAKGAQKECVIDLPFMCNESAERGVTRGDGAMRGGGAGRWELVA